MIRKDDLMFYRALKQLNESGNVEQVYNQYSISKETLEKFNSLFINLEKEKPTFHQFGTNERRKWTDTEEMFIYLYDKESDNGSRKRNFYEISQFIDRKELNIKTRFHQNIKHKEFTIKATNEKRVFDMESKKEPVEPLNGSVISTLDTLIEQVKSMHLKLMEKDQIIEEQKEELEALQTYKTSLKELEPLLSDLAGKITHQDERQAKIIRNQKKLKKIFNENKALISESNENQSANKSQIAYALNNRVVGGVVEMKKK